MTRAYLAFTAKGLALAEKLAAEYPGSVARCGHEPGQPGLADWTARQFAHSDALIFVGAVGIAVRAIAPHCKSKASDPAVVELARRLAAVCGAVPVITTATDANGVFAVDEWARHQNCAVLEPERIKKVSGALLAGRTVRFASDWPIAGSPPAGLAEDAAAPELALTLRPAGDALHLVPRIGVLGVGCRRGTGADTLAEAFAAFCAQAGLAPQCIAAAASIDLKQNEAGLLAFCQSRGWPVEFFTAEQLRQAPGSFTPSAFVQSVTGVDNVCERAAVLAAGGPLVFHKFARTGVTFALAARPFAPDWRWQHV